ncbi:MAG: FecR family protein [Verrucomicrobiota bacterium]
MSTPLHPIDDLQEKFLRLQNGDLDSNESDRLQTQLREDRDTRRALAEHFLLAAAVEEVFADNATMTASSAPRKRVIIPSWAPLAAAAAVLMVSAFLFFQRDESPMMVKAARPVATLILAENCTWKSSTAAPSEGQRLDAGQLDLLQGTAVIRFDGGAEVVLKGETSLRLQSSGSGELILGNVIVRAEEGADGFRLLTPGSPIVDLGTEFAARVDAAGATEVHVLDGKVEYQEGKSIKPLAAGKAIRFDASKRTPREVPLNSPRFDTIISEVNPLPRRELMRAYEGFQYEEGSLPIMESVGGKGWDGPWRRRLPSEIKHKEVERTPESFDIVHGQLNVTWPIPGGQLGMLKFPSGGAVLVRNLKKAIEMDRHGVTYFSLMIREMERQTARGTPREQLRLTFRSSEDFHGEAVSFGHGPGYQPRVQAGEGRTLSSPLVLPPEQTTLWIGKIVSRKNGDDEVYFRVYGEADTLGYAEPHTWHVVTRDWDLNAKLDRVLITSVGKSPRIIDELRIGPTWRSVAPMK